MLDRETRPDTCPGQNAVATRIHRPPPLPLRTSRTRTTTLAPPKASGFRLVAATLAFAASLTAMAISTRAAEPLIAPGDAVVSGFAGIRPSDAPMPPAASPLDHFVINLDGPSAQIMSLASLGGLPAGQLVTPVVKRQILARDVGQVFAITLADPQGGETPSIFLGATSAFGLNLVGPDADGNGAPDRLKTGAAGAQWMPGQFATDKGGSPGAIWRVDGPGGSASVFATLPDNSGPGIGDVVFDKASRHFFASDLDTGLIHRIAADGTLVDSFDHGVRGRPAKGLPAVADDGSRADITSPAFDTTKPETWGFTQKERMVYGMAVHDGRLYYAVDNQVFSIGIGADGSFASDVRWELDVTSLAADGPLTDMLFDAQGRMYLARRGAMRGSYEYGVFAEPDTSDVVRFRREDPDAAATGSRWVPEAQEYAIALPSDHRHADGGIALGYDYDARGDVRSATCGSFLWSTGDRLRNSSERAERNQDADVAGLQGNAVTDVRPANVPPTRAYFADYDGIMLDPEKAGHIGDVEIWQPCGARTPDFSGYPPGLVPPGNDIPPGFPPEFPPPEWPYRTNLRLTKEAAPRECWSMGANWVCRYNVFVTNTGPDAYFGDILVRDTFPENPPGLATFFANQPPWTCWQVGGSPADTRCWRDNVFLGVGQAVQLTVWAVVPKTPVRCALANRAQIEWAPGGSSWNFDPSDDQAEATSLVPDPTCPPPPPPPPPPTPPELEESSNLAIDKLADGPCQDVPGGYACRWRIEVENLGPDNFQGDVVLNETLPGLPVDWSWNAPWTCQGQGGGGAICTHANATIVTGTSIVLELRTVFSQAQVRELGCRLPNIVEIAQPAGSTPSNTDAGDDTAQADAIAPQSACHTQEPRCPAGFVGVDGRCVPRGQGGGRDPQTASCPQGTVGTPPNCRAVESCSRGETEMSGLKARGRQREGWSVRRRADGRWCGTPPSNPPPPSGPQCRDVWKDVCTVTPEQECRKVTDTACRMEPTSDCKTITRQQCTTEPKRDCRKVTENVCKMVPSQNCRNVTRQECSTRPNRKCQNVTTNVCRMVPKQNCRNVTSQNCINVPRQVCRGTGEFKQCTTQMQRVCRPASKRVCTSTMQRVCTPQTKTRCTTTSERVCRPVNQQVCTKDLKRVCTPQTSTRCTTTNQRVCKPVSERVCTKDVKRVCTPRTRTECSTVDKRSCRREKQTVCK